MNTVTAPEAEIWPRAKSSLALVALALFGGGAARMALSPMQELVRVDLNMTDNQVALLQGLAMALPLVFVSIPIGRLVDRSSRRNLLVALLVVAAAATVLTAFANTFIAMFVARMLVGVAFVSALPAAISLCADLSSAAQRGRTLAVVGLSQGLGSGAAFVLVGVLLANLPARFPPDSVLAGIVPWRAVQLVFAAALACVAAVLLLLREPNRLEIGGANPTDMKAVLRELKTHRRILIPMLAGVLGISMADAAAMIWAVPVLTRNLHLQPAEFGPWMGLGLFGSGVLGSLIGGFAADLGQRRAGARGLLLAAFWTALMSIPAAFFPLSSNGATFGLLLGLLLVAGSAAGIIATSIVALVIPNELRGITLSVMNGLGLVVTYGIAPSTVSVLAQVMGLGENIALPLAVVGVTMSLVGAISLFVGVLAVSNRRQYDTRITLSS